MGTKTTGGKGRAREKEMAVNWLYDNGADTWSQNVRLGSPMRVVVGLILLPSHCIHTLILGRVGRVEDVEVTVTLCAREKPSLAGPKIGG